MTQTAIRLKTTVLPSRRIEFTAPELTDGQEVEIFVALPKTETPAMKDPDYMSTVDFLASLPPSTLTAEDWARKEREMRYESQPAPRIFASAAEYLASLPVRRRTPEEWAVIERELKED